MKIDAVAVASSDLQKSIAFYTILGFEFAELKEASEHVEAKTSKNNIRLMIDHKSIIAKIIGEEPKPGNHSSFALYFDNSSEIDQVCAKISEAGFSIVKAPWAAFWGQHYAIVADPDGYRVDLFSPLE